MGDAGRGSDSLRDVSCCSLCSRTSRLVGGTRSADPGRWLLGTGTWRESSVEVKWWPMAYLRWGGGKQQRNGDERWPLSDQLWGTHAHVVHRWVCGLLRCCRRLRIPAGSIPKALDGAAVGQDGGAVRELPGVQEMRGWVA